MLIRAPETHGRSLIKAISWRATGSIDTFVLSWLITGSVGFAGSIASVEVFTKITLYYVHERAWSVISFGKRHPMPSRRPPVEAPFPARQHGHQTGAGRPAARPSRRQRRAGLPAAAGATAREPLSAGTCGLHRD